jgi:hypothetical protein
MRELADLYWRVLEILKISRYKKVKLKFTLEQATKALTGVEV